MLSKIAISQNHDAHVRSAIMNIIDHPVRFNNFVLTIHYDAILLCNPGAGVWTVSWNQSLPQSHLKESNKVNTNRSAKFY